jgi:hypothetical protein
LILTKVVVAFTSAAFKRKPRPLGLPRGGDEGSVVIGKVDCQEVVTFVLEREPIVYTSAQTR